MGMIGGAFRALSRNFGVGSGVDPTPLAPLVPQLAPFDAASVAGAQPQRATPLDAAGLDTSLPSPVFAAPTGLQGGRGGDAPSLPIVPQIGRTSNSPYKVDQSFIAGNEGGDRLVAYTVNPAWKFPYSGVTVGKGVDLGQQSVQSLTKWGLTPAQIAPLEPYLQRRGQSASDYLSAHPLTVSAPVAELLNRGAMEDMTRSVARAFDDADPTMNFVDLPASEQTVLADLAYQHGVGSLTDNLAKGRAFGDGAFWRHVTSNDLPGAISDLQNEALPGSPNYGYHRRLQEDAMRLRRGW